MKKATNTVIPGILTVLYSLNVIYLFTFLSFECSSFGHKIIKKLGVIGDIFATGYEFTYMYAVVAMIFSLIFIVALAFIFKKKSIVVAGVNIAAAIVSSIVFHSVQGNYEAHLKYEKLMVVFSFLFLASMIFMIYSAVKYIKSNKEIKTAKT